jgi:hypothetical protein
MVTSRHVHDVCVQYVVSAALLGRFPVAATLERLLEGHNLGHYTLDRKRIPGAQAPSKWDEARMVHTSSSAAP